MCRTRFALLFLVLASLGWAEDSDDLPFALRSNFLIVVHGSIGAQQELTFVVDTGTARTVVDLRIARAYPDSAASSAAFVTGHTERVPRIDITDLRFGPVYVPSLSVFVIDLANLSSIAGRRIDAILGLDALRLHNFIIDYKYKTLHFHNADRWQQETQLDADSPYPVVTTYVNGAPLRLLVDTGTDQITVFLHRLPRELTSDHLLPASGRNVSGSTTGATFLYGADVRLSSVRLPASHVFVLPSEPDFVAYDGHLGPNKLGATRVFLDFENGQLCWDN